MVAANNGETVFSVLGAAARRRGAIGLLVQLVASVALTTALLILAPQWWSLAFLAGWSAAYAGWGLLVRVTDDAEVRKRSLMVTLRSIAALGTVLAIAGLIGIGLAFYAGNGRGAKNACGKNSTNELCRAFADPPTVSGPLSGGSTRIKP